MEEISHLHIHGQKKITFSHSDPEGTLEKIKQPKSLLSRNEEVYVSKEVKVNALDLQQREIIPTRNEQQKINMRRVTISHYETGGKLEQKSSLYHTLN